MGLIRGVARTAVVAGTATAVSNRVSRRQSNRWASQEDQAYAEQQQQQQYYQQPPPQYQPAPEPAPDRYAQLAQLAQLKEQGVITAAEFEVEKAKILGQ